MSINDKCEFKGFLVYKDFDTQVREAGENHLREIAEANARMDNPRMAAAQQAAYEAALPDFLALPAGEVRRPVSDPRQILDQSLGYADDVAQRRRRLKAHVGHKFNVDLMFSLERYALGAMHAYKLHRDNPPPLGSLPKLVLECAAQRYRLSLGCDLAFNRKKELYAPLDAIDGSMMPEAIAYDILLFRRALIQSDAETNGSAWANFQELAHSEQLANTLLQATMNPAFRDALHWPTADIYARAYTLTHRACYEAECGLVELGNFDNADDPDEQYDPFCRFCEREASRKLCLHRTS